MLLDVLNELLCVLLDALAENHLLGRVTLEEDVTVRRSAARFGSVGMTYE